MKVSFLLTFLTVLNISATSFSQESSINLSVKNTPLLEVIKQIERQTDYRFFFSDNYQVLNQPVSLKVENKTIDAVLTELLEKKSVTYRKLDNKVIVITPAQTEDDKKMIKVSGTVTDAITGELLPGVSISVEGSTQATLTNDKGQFTLDIQTGANLQISFLGYSSQKVKVENQSALNIKLDADVKNLDEVVVVGYGTTKKSDLTGAVSSLKGAELTNTTLSNAAQMIQGRVAGLYVSSANTDPGSTPDIWLRGVGTFSSKSQPLLIIDNFQMRNLDAFNQLNANDIQQIDILKDASATAIYGAQGANGVIIVTTKSGQSGKLKIELSSKISTQTIAKELDMMSSDEYIRFYYDLAHDPSFAYSSWKAPIKTGVMYPYDIKDIGKLPNTRWQKEVENPNINQEHNVTISGGNDVWKFRSSANIYDGNAIVGPADYTRKNFATKIGYAKSKLTFSLDINYSNEKKNLNKNDYVAAARFQPTVSPRDSLGKLTPTPILQDQSWVANPLSNEEYKTRNGEYNSARIFGLVRYEILKGFTLEARMGWEKGYWEEYRYIKPFLSGSDTAQITNDNNGNMMNDLIANYNTKIGDHSFNIMVGTSYQTIQTRKSSMTGCDFPRTEISYYNIATAAGDITKMTNSWEERTTQSLFSRFNYDYKNRYLLTINYRIDGATQFGNDNKLGYFPSGAVAWKIDKEDFFPSNNGIVNDLKLKAGYGLAGNANVPIGRSETQLVYGSTYLGDGAAKTINWSGGYLSNPKLKWETTEMLNLGTEFGNKFFYAEFNYYNKLSKDLLIDRQVPTELGYQYITLNKGKMRNYGIEGKIDFYVNFFGGQLKWKPSIWGSYNHNEVINMDNDKVNSYSVWIGNWDGGYSGIRQKGYPFNALWGYNFKGIWKQSEATEAAKFGAVPGDPKYEDTDQNGIIDSRDKKYLGSTDPKYLAGFSNSLKYKGIELYFMFEGVFDRSVVNSNRLYFAHPYFAPYSNLSREALNRWTPDYQDTDIPSLTHAPTKDLVTSSWTIQDASFVRLKELTLSYSIGLPKSFRIDEARIFASVNNLFTLTKYQGVNPDVYGVDQQWNACPFTRVWTMGFNLSF